MTKDVSSYKRNSSKEKEGHTIEKETLHPINFIFNDETSPLYSKFTKEGQQKQPLHEIIAAVSIIKLREKVVQWLIWVYTGLLAATILIIFLQGFRAWGFELDPVLLKFLGGATVGEVAGLIAIVISSLFKEF